MTSFMGQVDSPRTATKVAVHSQTPLKRRRLRPPLLHGTFVARRTLASSVCMTLQAAGSAKMSTCMMSSGLKEWA
jgi:hypothetical protein